jgi:diaminohydroxyphosphoribosylaminopyrimidine deaminase/5-amino-6-(5-phosphoribosylamino)uracil reductase
LLDVRLVNTPRQPHLVVIDSRLQTPPSARLFQAPAHGLTRQTWIYHAVRDATKEAALQALGASLIHMPDANGKVDLSGMLKDLGQREVNELHVEAGHKLNGSFLREGLVDEMLMYLAPQLLGRGAGLANFGPLQRLQDGPLLRYESVERVGGDLRILARMQGRDAFLHPAAL